MNMVKRKETQTNVLHVCVCVCVCLFIGYFISKLTKINEGKDIKKITINRVA